MSTRLPPNHTEPSPPLQARTRCTASFRAVQIPVDTFVPCTSLLFGSSSSSGIRRTSLPTSVELRRLIESVVVASTAYLERASHRVASSRVVVFRQYCTGRSVPPPLGLREPADDPGIMCRNLISGSPARLVELISCCTSSPSPPESFAFDPGNVERFSSC